MIYDESVIKNVVDSSDIVSLISEYTRLEKKGNSYVGCCPFHNEKTPSFFVNPEMGLYNCFGCHEGGNITKFIMQIENVDFKTAIEMLAKRANIELPTKELSQEERLAIKHKKILYEINKEAANLYYKCLHKTENNLGREYLSKKRGLSDEIQKAFGLGYSSPDCRLIDYLRSKGYKDKDMLDAGVAARSSSGEIYDKFFGRVIFPIQDVMNNVIGFGGRILDTPKKEENNNTNNNNTNNNSTMRVDAKYMNTPETEIYHKRKNLFALNKARKSRRDELILVEGNMDVVSLHEAGFDNTVATLGTALTPEQAKLIKKYKRSMILIYDSDSAGVEAAFKAIPILRNEGIIVKVLNVVDAKDPDEYIKKFGKEKFEELLNTAIPYIEYELGIFDKRYDLNNSAEKKEYINKVFERIKNVTDSIDRELYIEKFSEKVCIDKEIIKEKLIDNRKRLYEDDTKKEQANTNNEKTEESMQNENKHKQLISLMLNDNILLGKIQKHITSDMMKTEFLKELVKQIYIEFDKNSNVDLANFLNKFEKLEDQNEIVSIVALMKKIKGSEAEKVADRLVKGILNSDLDKKISEINIKIKNFTEQVNRSEEDTQCLNNLTLELSELVKKKNKINKINILED